MNFMDYIRNNKKRILVSVILLAVTGTFILSYFIYTENYNLSNKKENNTVTSSEKNESLTVHSQPESKLTKEGKATFKVKYKKSGEVKVIKEEELSSLIGKTKSQIEDAFKDEGYKVEDITSNKVTLTKEVDRYAPNKYVLGIRDGFIAIFKTDSEGNMFMENEKTDVTDIRVEKLKKEDINLLTRGDKYFQCNSREDAKSKLEDYE